MFKKFAKYILVLLLFTACSSQETEKYFSFPDNTWKRFENPLINLEVSSPGIFYNLYIVAEYDIATAPDFIPITVITSTPDGEVRARDIRLRFKETSGQAKEVLRLDFAFSEVGNCSFEIENRSQHLEMIGIKKIGIELEKID
jgi:hypothetical protein